MCDVMPFDWMNFPPLCFCVRNFVIKMTRSTPLLEYKPIGEIEPTNHRLLVMHFTFSSLRQRLHERGFICNRIVFDAVMPSVYTTPTETVAETGSI